MIERFIAPAFAKARKSSVAAASDFPLRHTAAAVACNNQVVECKSVRPPASAMRAECGQTPPEETIEAARLRQAFACASDPSVGATRMTFRPLAFTPSRSFP